MLGEDYSSRSFSPINLKHINKKIESIKLNSVKYNKLTVPMIKGKTELTPPPSIKHIPTHHFNSISRNTNKSPVPFQTIDYKKFSPAQTTKMQFLKLEDSVGRSSKLLFKRIDNKNININSNLMKSSQLLRSTSSISKRSRNVQSTCDVASLKISRIGNIEQTDRSHLIASHAKNMSSNTSINPPVLRSAKVDYLIYRQQRKCTSE